jgi:hypothetical protein
MILPSHSLQAFYSKSSELCRQLGISTQLDQPFFHAVACADQEESFSSCSLSEAMECIAQIGRQHNMYFAPHDVNISAEAIHENATRI